MSKPPTLASVMTPFPYAVDAGAPVSRARELMAEHNVRHLPVTRDGHTIGIVGAQDLLLLRRLVAANDTVPGEGGETPLTVAHVCSDGAYVVDIHTPLAAVAKQMAQRRISAAVVERKGKLAGILTSTDVARTLAELLDGKGPASPPEPA